MTQQTTYTFSSKAGEHHYPVQHGRCIAAVDAGRASVLAFKNVYAKVVK